jgi:hypothetical protein
MRTLFLIAACAALAACAQEAEQPAPKASDAVSVPTIPTLASFAGTYDYTLADGTTGVTTMMPDGTFTDVMRGESVTGSWRVTDAKVCIDPAGDAADQQTACYTIGEPDAEGAQTAIDDSGAVTKIKRKTAV